VHYSITVRQIEQVTAAIAAIDETAWTDIDYTNGGVAQVAETTLGKDQRRLVVRRTRLVGQQAQLWPDWRHHAFVTIGPATPSSSTSTTATTPCASLPSATSKHGAGLVHCRSGVFTANAAWAVLATLAHNLLRWTAILGGFAAGPVVAKTIRRRYLTIPDGSPVPRENRRCTCQRGRVLTTTASMPASNS
jgi:hypothetical protein